MRVVGYVRETTDQEDTRPAFVQQEELRRWTAENGHDLVAVCRDTRPPRGPTGRDGYLALLGVVGSGGVDGVAVPGLATLSADQVVQEILLWDLRSRGVRVVSTQESDAAVMGPEAPGPTRQFIRDVLSRVAEHAALLERRDLQPPPGPVDLIVELLEESGPEH